MASEFSIWKWWEYKGKFLFHNWFVPIPLKQLLLEAFRRTPNRYKGEIEPGSSTGAEIKGNKQN